MEVASPLTFGHVKAGSKRRFATCSPLDTAIEPHAPVDDYAMDDSAAYGSSFKRRRCDNMEMSHVAAQNSNNPFGSTQLSIPQVQTPFGNKRQRSDDSPDDGKRQLLTIIDRQNTEIRKLKSEKSSIESSYQELSATNDKHQKENTALKKVLAIKQERQDHFVVELDNARRYKEQAEQLIAVLKHHLHAQQSHGNNAGLGFNNGGPHVF